MIPDHVPEDVADRGEDDPYAPRDYDYMRGFLRPAGWRRIKTALGPSVYGFQDLCLAVETFSPGIGDPCRVLAAAIFHFVTLPRVRQIQCHNRYLAWLHNADALAIVPPTPAGDHDARARLVWHVGARAGRGRRA